MLIATWNVNSIKQRIENLSAWLKERQPDMVCLQETKCVDESFPREPSRCLGYNRRGARPKDIQRRGDPLQAHFRRSDAALPGKTKMTMPGSSKGRSTPTGASVSPPSTFRTETRQIRKNTL